MNKITINDWQTLQTRKEIQNIRKTMAENKTASWTIVIELILVLAGFFLNNIFPTPAAVAVFDSTTGQIISQTTNSGVNWPWVTLSVLALGIPLVIAIRTFVKKKREEAREKLVRNTHEMITKFDDEVCYYIMTADSFIEAMNNLQKDFAPVDNAAYVAESEQNTGKPDDEMYSFYQIEASYYLNKSAFILNLMENNLKNLVEKKDGTDNSHGQKISYFRFNNVLTIMRDMYLKLGVNVEQIDKEGVKEGIPQESNHNMVSNNENYYNMLKSVREKFEQNK